jgi:hypothetical protein
MAGDEMLCAHEATSRPCSGIPCRSSPAFRVCICNQATSRRAGPQKSYFFKGSQYIRYDIKADKADAAPMSIVKYWKGLEPFSSGIDAAVAWPNGKIYFFKGSNYIRYDIKADKADAAPMPIVNYWHGLDPFKDGIDAVTVWPNGKAYFFKGTQYIRYDIKADKADGGPRSIFGNWKGVVW